MDCEEVKRRIACGEADDRVVEEHVAACEGCRTYLEQQVSLASAMDSWEDVAEPADVPELVLRGGLVQRTLAERLPWERPWFARAATVAAMAGVVVILFGATNTSLRVEDGGLTLRLALHPSQAPAIVSEDRIEDIVMPAIYRERGSVDRAMSDVALSLWMQRENDLTSIKREMYGMATWMEQELDKRDARMVELIEEVSGEAVQPEP